MGFFSWLDCIDKSQILIHERKNVYVLVPKRFGGGHIVETFYDGYGNFGFDDIYELVADWNRTYLSKHPDFVLPSVNRKVSEYCWYEAYINKKNSHEDIVNITRTKYDLECFEYRDIGIALSCEDEDNAVIKYPIKITHNPDVVYEDCEPSLYDEHQGCRASSDEDEW